jgi:hypothetical protein
MIKLTKLSINILINVIVYNNKIKLNFILFINKKLYKRNLKFLNLKSN